MLELWLPGIELVHLNKQNKNTSSETICWHGFYLIFPGKKHGMFTDAESKETTCL
jgi:hypothetical protein